MGRRRFHVAVDHHDPARAVLFVGEVAGHELIFTAVDAGEQTRFARPRAAGRDVAEEVDRIAAEFEHRRRQLEDLMLMFCRLRQVGVSLPN
jgi:hypothetical protein